MSSKAPHEPDFTQSVCGIPLVSSHRRDLLDGQLLLRLSVANGAYDAVGALTDGVQRLVLGIYIEATGVDGEAILIDDRYTALIFSHGGLLLVIY